MGAAWSGEETLVARKSGRLSALAGYHVPFLPFYRLFNRIETS